MTDEEAERAVAAFVDCAAADGLAIESRRDSGGYTFVHSSEGDGDDESRTFDRCERRNYMLVGMMLGIQDALPGDVLAERDALVAECLIDQGYPVEGWPATDADLDPSAEARCVDRAGAAIDR